MKPQLFLYLFLMIFNFIPAQKSDTIHISSKNLKTSQLKEGKSQYLVYIQNGKNAPISEMQIWNITTSHEFYKNKKAIMVSQVWYYKDTIAHTSKSISLSENFKPIYHDSWWKKRGKQTFDIENKKFSFNDAEVAITETNPQIKMSYESFKSSEKVPYFINWHLDLEVFSMLPFSKNAIFFIPFYEFGYDTPKEIIYKVTGEDKFLYNGESINCWILEHIEEGNHEKFWISKKTNEVLKMKQLINDKIYRYKIKLPE